MIAEREDDEMVATRSALRDEQGGTRRGLRDEQARPDVDRVMSRAGPDMGFVNISTMTWREVLRDDRGGARGDLTM